MKIAIVGSRDYPYAAAVEQVGAFVRALPPDTVIVSGGARGPDTLAFRAAESAGLVTVVYRADWERLGRGAGMIRNSHIVDQADKVVAFWDGVSRGTLDTIRKAVAAGKPVEIRYPTGEVEIRAPRVTL